MDIQKSLQCNREMICSSLEAIEPMLAQIPDNHSIKQRLDFHSSEGAQAEEPEKNRVKQLDEIQK